MPTLINNQQKYRKINKAKIEKAVRNILSLLEQPAAELSILFVGDRRMQQLNSAFRGIPETTDVLSFEAAIPVKQDRYDRFRPGHSRILGDVVISIPRAISEARSSGVGLHDEICRLLVHGVLHLIGYTHETSGPGADSMRKKEEEILIAVKKMD